MEPISILLLMILCHIIDDFVLQPICLSKLKQKDWWRNQKDYHELYKNDYKAALAIHSISWSIMVLLPIIFFIKPPQLFLFIIFVGISWMHYRIDDLKANDKEINLITDQIAHFFEILLAWSLCFL